MADIYSKFDYLQYEFIENHSEISPNVFETVYSDGSKTVVDYNTKTYKLIKQQKEASKEASFYLISAFV